MLWVMLCGGVGVGVMGWLLWRGAKREVLPTWDENEPTREWVKWFFQGDAG